MKYPIQKTIILFALASILFILFLSVFKTCNTPDHTNTHQSNSDSLRFKYDALQTKYDCLICKFQFDTLRLHKQYEIIYVRSQKDAQKYLKIINDIRKLSNDSAHVILKRDYEPVQVLTKIYQLDSCNLTGQNLSELLSNQIELNTIKTEAIFRLTETVESFSMIADTCIIQLGSCGTDLQKQSKKNESLKKWRNGLGIALGIFLARDGIKLGIKYLTK